MNQQFTNAARAAMLRAIADDLEGLPVDAPRPPAAPPAPVVEVPTLAPEGAGHPNDAIVDGVFVRDFWQVGVPGATKGASAKQYEAAFVVTGMLTGERPRHTKILTAGPGRYWTENIRSAADVGWIDGSQYRPPEGASSVEIFRAWVAAGCPSESVFGKWGGDGTKFVPFDYSILPGAPK